MNPIDLPPIAVEAFRRQDSACRALGSDFTGFLCALFAERGVPAGPVHERLANWPGRIDGGGDAVPLRLTGALHYLVLSGRDPELAAVYPPHAAGDEAIADTVMEALGRHAAFVADYLDSPPQTNETARSAVLLPAFLLLQARFALPLVLSEPGSSAGLNQNWHRYRYDYGNWSWGDPASPVVLGCEWRGGAAPEPLAVSIADCAGCDIAPVAIDTEEARLRLKSYVWADQEARLARLDGALSLAADHPPTVARAGAGDWLAERLGEARPGALHTVFHTIMWQYMPPDEQERARGLIEDAGRRAGADAPIAWLRLEADGKPDGAALLLTVWSGEQSQGETLALGRGDFHGRWVDWRAASGRP